MSIKGQVKYAGYKTGGKVKIKGLRNHRSAVQRKKQEAEARKVKREERNKEDLERRQYRRD